MFRDELTNLLPGDTDAHRLAKQSLTLAELLTPSGYQPGELHRRAILQTYCHHSAIIGTGADDELMTAMGLDNPQYGCELSPIDFVSVAEGCGLQAFRVENAGQAHETLAAALCHDGPSLVECIVDPYETPFGDVLEPQHADNIASAYERGEPGRERMARSLLEPGKRALSPAVQHAEQALRKHA